MVRSCFSNGRSTMTRVDLGHRYHSSSLNEGDDCRLDMESTEAAACAIGPRVQEDVGPFYSGRARAAKRMRLPKQGRRQPVPALLCRAFQSYDPEAKAFGQR